MKKYPEPDPVSMTPMIDMVFQLIIFFVCSMDMSSKNFTKDIKLAKAPNAPENKSPTPGTMYINLSRDGVLKIGKTPISGDQLRGMLANAVGRYGNQFPVVVRADGGTQHAYVKSVLNILANSKVINISFSAAVPENR